ncbi:MAG: hypothetical protein PHF86_10005 [Candidatus Nanoarchaeia archaeon]|nr:hypothetical protein [Candidatus Nanoarchaeia archaeon]
MKIIKETEMPLLNRKDVIVQVEHPTTSTPSKEQLRKSISSLLKAPEELIEIKKVNTKFGEGKSDVDVSVYIKKEDHDYLEKKKVKKDAKKEEKK